MEEESELVPQHSQKPRCSDPKSIAGKPTAGTSQQGPMCSLIELLHDAPALLELLPPGALKTLSATCRSFRTSFRARVKVVTVPHPDAAAYICSASWPQLLVVACELSTFMDGQIPAQLENLLSPQWECMLHVSLIHFPLQTLNVVLLRPRQQEHNPLTDLPIQHSTALSSLADMRRLDTINMQLRGPLVGCSAVQYLTRGSWPELGGVSVVKSPQLGVEGIAHLTELRSVPNVDIRDSFLNAPMLLKMAAAWPRLREINLTNNQLDGNAISALTCAKWPCLRQLDLSDNPLGIAGIQHLVSWSLPSLNWLRLENVGIDVAASFYLAQGHWPVLRGLVLYGNNIGISHLVQGNWPYLSYLDLSAQGLDQEAYVLLGIAHSYPHQISKDKSRGGHVTCCYRSCLPRPQYTQLTVLLT